MKMSAKSWFPAVGATHASPSWIVGARRSVRVIPGHLFSGSLTCPAGHRAQRSMKMPGLPRAPFGATRGREAGALPRCFRVLLTVGLLNNVIQVPFRVVNGLLGNGELRISGAFQDQLQTVVIILEYLPAQGQGLL